MMNLNRFARLVAVGVGLLAPGWVQADILVDDFQVAVPPLVVNFGNSAASANSTLTIGNSTTALREISLNSGFPVGDGQAEVTGGAFVLNADQALQNDIVYSGFSLNVADRPILLFNFNQVQNLSLLAVSLFHGGMAPVGGLYSVPNASGASQFAVNLSEVPGWSPAFANGIEQISVSFATDATTVQVNLDRIAFTEAPTPVPETATWAVAALGVALAVGRFVRRKRSRGTA